jgi:hypothetical protein
MKSVVRLALCAALCAEGSFGENSVDEVGESLNIQAILKELKAVRELALSQNEQITQQQVQMQQQDAHIKKLEDVLLSKEQRRLLESPPKSKRRKALDSDASGIQIKKENAMLALGEDGDVVFQRSGESASFISGTVHIEKIHVASINDILVGNTTLGAVLNNTYGIVDSVVVNSEDYSSCFELLNADDSYYEQDGTYTFTTSGGVSYQAYCDMTTDGGGWTLAAKMANSDLDKNWVNGADDWTSSTTYGDVTQIGTDDADAKGRAWSTVKANQIMLKDSSSGSDYIMTTEKSRCFNDVTMSDYFGAALFYHFPGYGSSCYYYERCDVSSSYTPDWLTSSDSYGQSDGIEYITIAYTDSSGDTSAVISGLDDSCAEADVGLGALESGTAWFDIDDGSGGGQTQDIGGPTHCSSAYDDSSCADTYPDTVYYFVREATPRHHVTGTSCKNILDNNPEIEGMDGTYTIEHSDGSTYQAYCDMTSDDGGWQLVAKMSNYDDKNWCTSYDDWTSTDVYGDTADIYDIGNDAKGFGWSDVTATQMMFRDSYSQTQYCRTAEDIDSQTMAEYFASALDTGFPGYGGSCDYYQKLTTTCSNDWVPSWLTDGSSNAQDPIEYLLISYTDNSGDTSAVISGFSDSCGEADVGIGSLEGGMSWYDSSDGYSGGLSQDIGSPTECSYDDDTCFYTDHQTAFVFVR